MLVDRFAGQQHFGFDSAKGCGDQNKLARQIDVQALHLMDVVQKIICDLGYRNVVNVQFIPLNKEKQQVEWTFKLRKPDGKGVVLSHSAAILQRRYFEIRKFVNTFALSAYL